jgi:hypothetical protein
MWESRSKPHDGRPLRHLWLSSEQDAGPAERRHELPLSKLREPRSEVDFLEQERPVGTHRVGTGKVVERTPYDGIVHGRSGGGDPPHCTRCSLIPTKLS